MPDIHDFVQQEARISGHIAVVSSAQPTSASRLAQVCVWLAVLLASSVSTIVWVGALGYKDSPDWDPYVRLLGLVGILALTWFWSSLHPIRGFLWALLALQVGSITMSLFEKIPPVAIWLKALPPYQYIFVNALLWVAFPTSLMVLTLIGSGLSRQDLFLTKGNARARGRLLFPGLPALSWAILGPVLFAIFVGPLLWQLIVTVRPDFTMSQGILGALPFILGFALINSAQEEFRFRLVFFARLVPVIGARQTLLLTSILFGLGHWVGGHPSGPVGALIAGLGGWIVGASILETRGVTWAWLLHICSDAIVITLLVMTTVLR